MTGRGGGAGRVWGLAAFVIFSTFSLISLTISKSHPYPSPLLEDGLADCHPFFYFIGPEFFFYFKKCRHIHIISLFFCFYFYLPPGNGVIWVLVIVSFLGFGSLSYMGWDLSCLFFLLLLSVFIPPPLPLPPSNTDLEIFLLYILIWWARMGGLDLESVCLGGIGIGGGEERIKGGLQGRIESD